MESAEFDRVIEKMKGLMETLESSASLTRDNLKGIPKRGVYVFYEGADAINVG